MNDRDVPRGPVERRVSCLVQAVAGELSALHGRMGGLQGTLIGLVAQLPGAENHWSELQEIDRVTQVLSELSLFLVALSSDLPPALVAEVGSATSQLTLGELQRRLLGDPGSVSAVATGSIELF